MHLSTFDCQNLPKLCQLWHQTSFIKRLSSGAKLILVNANNIRCIIYSLIECNNLYNAIELIFNK